MYRNILKKPQLMGIKTRYYYHLVVTGIRVIRNEGWRSFWTRFKEWLLQNTPPPLKLLWWRGAGQFGRAEQALFTYYQRFVPMRIKGIIPDKLQKAVVQWLGRQPDLYFFLQHALSLGKRGNVDRAKQVCDEALNEFPPNAHVPILRTKAVIEINNALFEDVLSTIRSLARLNQHGNAEARFLIALREEKVHKHSVKLGSNDEKLLDYWNTRANFVYLHVCKRLINIIGRSASVVADIGSNRTPLLDFFPSNPVKYSVDPATPYSGKGVTPVREDFLHWIPPQKIEFCTCLQVLEHVPDASRFAKRLLEVCEVSLVSVPYKEEPGGNISHIHSMIDYKVISTWFEREPNFFYVAKELGNEERIICVFDRTMQEKFKTLSESCMNGLKYRYRWSLAGSGFEDIAENFMK